MSIGDELSHWVTRLKEGAAYVQQGNHGQGVSLLTEVQALQSPMVANVCQAVLATFSQADDRQLTIEVYAHYEACRILRCVIIRDWSYWSDQAAAILSFAEQFLMDNSNRLVSRADCSIITNEISDLWAGLWKLQWGVLNPEQGQGSDDPSDATRQLLHSLGGRLVSLINGPSLDAQVVARHLLACTVREFGVYHIRSQGRGLSLRQHELCRQAFGTICLLPLADVMVRDLDRLMQNLSSDVQSLCAAGISALHVILCWRFAESYISSDAIQEEAPSMLPVSEEWKHFLLNQSASGPFLSRSIQQLCCDYFFAFQQAGTSGLHRVQSELMETVLQLCGVYPKSEFWTPAEMAQYADNCITVLFNLVQNVMTTYGSTQGAGVAGELLLKCCTCFERLASSFSADCALFYHQTLPEKFIAPLVLLTQAVVEKSMADEDDEILTEGLNELLNCWSSMVAKGLADPSMKAKIGDLAVGSAVAEGSATVFKVFVHSKLQQSRSSTAEPTDEASHAEEYARSHTELVALLGREQPSLASAYLASQLRGVANDYLTTMQQRKFPSRQMHEAMWYLLTISGHFLSDSESNEIPLPIATAAFEMERQYPNDIRAQEANNDVLKLVQIIVQLSKDITPFLCTQSPSPGVIDAIMFALKRYASCYLFPDTSLQLDAADVFASAFEQGVAFADAAAKFAAASISAMPTEPATVAEACSLLAAFVRKSSDFEGWFVQQPVFQTLLQIASTGSGAVRLQGKHRGELCYFLISICPTPFLQQLVLPHIIPSLQQVLQQQQHNDVVDTVDTIQKLCKAICTQQLMDAVYPSVHPLIDLAVRCIHSTREKPLLVAVLQLLDTLITDVAQLMEEQHYLMVVQASLQTVDYVSEMMKAAREEMKQKERTASKEWLQHEQSEQENVLIACAQLVSSIATWSVFGYNASDTNDGVDISQLCVHGLMTVLRFVTDNLLAIPELSGPLFQLLQEVSLSHTHELMKVSTDDATLITSAIAYAVRDVNNMRYGFGAIEAFASFSMRSRSQLPLLPSLLQMLAENCANGSNRQATAALASALYQLIPAVGVDLATQTFGAAFAAKSQLLHASYTQLEHLIRTTNFAQANQRDINAFEAKLEVILQTARGTVLW